MGVLKNIDDIILSIASKANPSKAEQKLLSEILSGLNNTSSNLSSYKRSAPVLSDVAENMSEFMTKKTAGLGKGQPLILTTKDLPQESRDSNLVAVSGLDYKTGRLLTPDAEDTQQDLKENILNFISRGGDPNFYWTGYEGLEMAAPSLDEATRALTFAPFSAGASVPQNIRLWSRFIENPEMFAGRIKGEGGLTAGGAQQKAMRVALRNTPQVADLSEGGQIVKVGSFGENLWLPGSSRRATVDRHAVKNAMGVYTPVTPPIGDVRQYRAYEKAFIDAADELGMAPHEAQSAAWDAWRQIMHKNPENKIISTADFTPLNVSPIFSLSPEARKFALADMISDPQLRDNFIKEVSSLDALKRMGK